MRGLRYPICFPRLRRDYCDDVERAGHDVMLALNLGGTIYSTRNVLEASRENRQFDELKSCVGSQLKERK